MKQANSFNLLPWRMKDQLIGILLLIINPYLDKAIQRQNKILFLLRLLEREVINGVRIKLPRLLI
jgi:hypothetical protein